MLTFGSEMLRYSYLGTLGNHWKKQCFRTVGIRHTNLPAYAQAMESIGNHSKPLGKQVGTQGVGVPQLRTEGGGQKT